MWRDCRDADTGVMAKLVSLPQPAHAVEEDEVYRQHGAALERFCLSIVRDPHEAADAAQDAWLRALTALRAGARPENFQAWLFAIARNRCTDTFRVVRTQAFDDSAQAVADPRPQVDEQYQQCARLQTLWNDLWTLSDAQRSAFVMSEVLGLSGEELAFAMRRSTNSCRDLTADARTAVRDRQRGRDAGCEDIRAQLKASRGHSRFVGAHLEVCGECSKEARRERARRLLRSLAVVPLPLPLFGRLQATHARLGTLLHPGGPVSERAAAAIAAGAATAAIALGGVAAAPEAAPQAAAARHALPTAHHGRPPAQGRVAARPAMLSRRPVQHSLALTAARPPAHSRRAAPSAPAPASAAPSAPSRTARSPFAARTRGALDQVRRTTATVLSEAAEPVAPVPARVAAVFEAVDPITTTSALNGLSPLPNS
jgi:RNA polymerase sigma-70 factor (ECF subfamily)